MHCSEYSVEPDASIVDEAEDGAVVTLDFAGEIADLSQVGHVERAEGNLLRRTVDQRLILGTQRATEPNHCESLCTQPVANSKSKPPRYASNNYCLHLAAFLVSRLFVISLRH